MFMDGLTSEEWNDQRKKFMRFFVSSIPLALLLGFMPIYLLQSRAPSLVFFVCFISLAFITGFFWAKLQKTPLKIALAAGFAAVQVSFILGAGLIKIESSGNTWGQNETVMIILIVGLICAPHLFD
ncbi:MAG: hypothetical protein LUE17_15485 [Planctomycetaceae bacterium]|nr:hypothetical protein [Planctomycetaceae bacterium]